MRISIKDFFSVNASKSAVSCGFGHIYWRNPLWKTSFFVQLYNFNFWHLDDLYFINTFLVLFLQGLILNTISNTCIAKLLLFIYYYFILHAFSSSFPQNNERLAQCIRTWNPKYPSNVESSITFSSEYLITIVLR